MDDNEAGIRYLELQQMALIFFWEGNILVMSYPVFWIFLCQFWSTLLSPRMVSEGQHFLALENPPNDLACESELESQNAKCRMGCNKKKVWGPWEEVKTAVVVECC